MANHPLLANHGNATHTLYLNTEEAPRQLLGQVASPLNALIMNRPSFAHVEVDLKDGEKVLAKGGAMLWMDSALQMSTSCYGGFGRAYCRTCALESCCQNVFTGPGKIAFGFDLPGDILPFLANPGEGWILSTGSFICGTPNTAVSAQFSGCPACMCAGEGPFLVHVSSMDGAPAVFYAGDYGAIQRHDVPAGRNFFVKAGLFFATSDKVPIQISLPDNCKTCICGGEGLVLKFTGPCSVFTQNRDPAVIRKLLNPHVPAADGGAGNGADAGGAAAAGGP
jgi:uncharacterized protein (TIGR00266 family)